MISSLHPPPNKKELEKFRRVIVPDPCPENPWSSKAVLSKYSYVSADPAQLSTSILTSFSNLDPSLMTT